MSGGTAPCRLRGVFLSTEPAWNDRNLREIAAQLESGHVFAHIRASTGSAVQKTNCHPFRHGRRLWMHNGLIAGFPAVRRELTLAVDPLVFPEIQGSTDPEILFYLAVTFGLEADPVAAVASEARSRSLFHSVDVSTLRHQYPDNPALHVLSDDARLVVSEPLGELRGAWREVPESTCIVVHGGREELRPFTPVAPAAATADGVNCPVPPAPRERQRPPG